MQSQGVVIDGVANLYSKPRTDVDLVTQAIVGTTVCFEKSEEGWYEVGTPDGYGGWIESRHVRAYAEGVAPYASTRRVAEVTSLLAFLFHGQSVSARAPAMQVTLSARLEVAGEGEDWVQVALPDGSERWVKRGDVAVLEAGIARPRGSIEEVVQTAKRFLGLPYLWGGSTPLGIDCSGIVQLAYGLHGVRLLRDSRLQYTQPDLAPVDRDKLQDGDLVFFGAERITHVGLYLGQGEFIHATPRVRPVVQISRLEEAHWMELYQGARRP
jgi:cell wall-associated NlpC family hydrolase